MRLYLRCKYCGWHWVDYTYDIKGLSTIRCPRCNDKNLEQVKEENKDVFGYDVDKKDLEK